MGQRPHRDRLHHLQLPCRARRSSVRVLGHSQLGPLLHLKLQRHRVWRSAPEGRSVFLLAGEVSYALPAPPGRWLPNARCEVYREACSYPVQDAANQEACLKHRGDCALTESDAIEPSSGQKQEACRRHGEPEKQAACLVTVADSWFCQNRTLVQPCNWDRMTRWKGDPSLLGKSLYQLPLMPVDMDFPFACAAGLRGSTDPKTQSSSACGGPCPPGTASAEGTGSCKECEPGTYAANRGQGECTRCPYPLASARGNITCYICTDGFYLLDSSAAAPKDIWMAPTEHCKPCPPNANCNTPSTTITSLGVGRGYWRASTATARLYTCDSSDTCIGSSPATDTSAGRALASRKEIRGPYCAAGHIGPLCLVCSEGGRYFSLANRHCVDCPGEWRLAVIAVAVVLGAGIVVAAAALLKGKWEPKRECLAKLLRRSRAGAEMAKSAGLWTKLKIAISFYQCLAAIPSGYARWRCDRRLATRPHRRLPLRRPGCALRVLRDQAQAAHRGGIHAVRPLPAPGRGACCADSRRGSLQGTAPRDQPSRSRRLWPALGAASRPFLELPLAPLHLLAHISQFSVRRLCVQ